MPPTALPAWPAIYVAAVKVAAEAPLEKQAIDFSKLNPFRQPGTIEQLLAGLKQHAPQLAEDFYNSNLRGHVEQFAKDPAGMIQSGLGHLQSKVYPKPGQQPGRLQEAASGALNWLHERVGRPESRQWLQDFASPLKSTHVNIDERDLPAFTGMGYEVKPGQAGSFDVTRPGLINQLLYRLKGQNQQQ